MEEEKTAVNLRASFRGRSVIQFIGSTRTRNLLSSNENILPPNLYAQ